MSEKDDALQAIEVAIAVHRAVRAKLEEVIAHKKFFGGTVDEERAEKARLNRKLGDLRDLQVELTAAGSVVSAPSVEEIREVRALITEINDLSLEDATRKAGLALMKSALERARELGRNAKPG
jgi:hypothetical protein